ncbi:MAG: WecB/TagA/CpsF family glycosyltransferase, partial [Planctomycetota bacterium]
GCHSPPFGPLGPAEDQRVVDMINASGADVVWVGLGAPKQERWMAAHLGRIKAPVMLGVGAAFDFHAGLLKRAPRLFQRAGLEWLFRLLMEPRRLWRRYLRANTEFAFLLAGELLAGPFRRGGPSGP